jgi:hypothetical protein
VKKDEVSRMGRRSVKSFDKRMCSRGTVLHDLRGIVAKLDRFRGLAKDRCLDRAFNERVMLAATAVHVDTAPTATPGEHFSIA